MKDLKACVIANREVSTSFHFDIIRTALLTGDAYSAREALYEAMLSAIDGDNKRTQG